MLGLRPRHRGADAVRSLTTSTDHECPATRPTPASPASSAARSRPVAGPRVFEDGGQLRDFVSVHDVAVANRLAIEAPAALGGAFNIASGRPRSVLELASALARAVPGPAPEVTGAYRLGDVRHVFAATNLAREELGFRARVAFSDGIGEFAEAPLRAPIGARAS